MLNIRTTSAALIAVLFLSVQPLHADTLIIVNHGGNRSADVTGHTEARVNWLDADRTDDTMCTECFAALELQNYLQKLTGNLDDFDTLSRYGQIKQEDLILVGNPATSPVLKKQVEKLGIDLTKHGLDPKQLLELGAEGYRIKSFTTGGRRITFVTGNHRVGTLYAAYDLLHRLGCRWLGPGDVNEEISHIDGISDMDVTERPSFELRRFHSFESRYQPENAELFLWMARNRMNSWCTLESMAPLMRKLGIQMSCGEHNAEAMFVGPRLPYPYDYPLFEGDEKKPKDPYQVSNEYKGDVNKDGVLSYFEAHPEWYALVRDQRIPGISGNGGYNYCTSNLDATAEFVKNYVQALIDGQYKHGDVVLVWTLDAGSTDTPYWCDCKTCKAQGTPTDRYLRLVYLFDKEIKKAQAAGKINRPIATRFMIYRDVLGPPTKPLPDDFDYKTCTGTFFPAVRCYHHHFDDSQCSINQRFQEQLKGWVSAPDRFYRGPVGIGEYYNVNRFRNLPLCLMHSMAHDIPYFYKECGVRQFDYMHVSTENWGSKSLTNYQMARQLWSVDTDPEVLWEDYFLKRYGPAAKTMRMFYEELERINIREIKSELIVALKNGDKGLFNTSHLRYDHKAGQKNEAPTWLENMESVRRCRELLETAMATKVPERMKARMKEDEGLFEYAEGTMKLYNACIEGFRSVRAGNDDKAKQWLAEAERIVEVLRKDTTAPAYSWDYAKKPNAYGHSNTDNTLKVLKELLTSSNSARAKRP